MSETIKIESVINRQIAHCMAAYGDRPDELMYKLQQLVIEWHCKGIEIGIVNERKHNATPKKVNRYTRASGFGKNIACPHCSHAVNVKHFAWSAATCTGCKADVNKYDWLDKGE